MREGSRTFWSVFHSRLRADESPPCSPRFRELSGAGQRVPGRWTTSLCKSVPPQQSFGQVALAKHRQLPCRPSNLDYGGNAQLGQRASGGCSLFRPAILATCLSPHGDLAEELLHHVSPRKADHLVFFNPGDLEFPIGLNVLANVAPDFHQRLSADFPTTASFCVAPAVAGRYTLYSRARGCNNEISREVFRA